jgi:hypothetical protein
LLASTVRRVVLSLPNSDPWYVAALLRGLDSERGPAIAARHFHGDGRFVEAAVTGCDPIVLRGGGDVAVEDAFGFREAFAAFQQAEAEGAGAGRIGDGGAEEVVPMAVRASSVERGGAGVWGVAR